MKRDNMFHRELLNEFSEIIEKSKFRELVTKKHFKQEYRIHQNQDGYHDLYIVGYGKNRVKLAFFYEYGLQVYVQIGLIDSITNSWESMIWISIDYLISYLNKEPIDRDFKRALHKDSIKDKLSDMAVKFIPLSDKIISMFKNEETIAQWRPLLDAFIEEDTRRRYKLK